MTDKRDVSNMQVTDVKAVNESNKVSELIIYYEGENYNNPEYELTDDYKAVIESTFDYWNRNLSFYKLPFSYKQRWFNVEMQSGGEVVEPGTMAKIPVPIMSNERTWRGNWTVRSRLHRILILRTVLSPASDPKSGTEWRLHFIDWRLCQGYGRQPT